MFFPCGDKRDIDCWSLLTFGGGKSCIRTQRFCCRQNRGVRKICRGRKAKVSRPYFHFAILRRLARHRVAYKPCRRSCGRLSLTQFRRFPVLTEERTASWANECSIESPCTATHGRRAPYFRKAGNKNDVYQNPILHKTL